MTADNPTYVESPAYEAFVESRGSSAVISLDGVYRYQLARIWDQGPLLCWVMLNPSTADASVDDNTIRRVVGFTRRLGLAGALVVNLFAFRATDPSELSRVEDPVGPDNDAWIRRTAVRCATVVAGWGAPAIASARAKAVERIVCGDLHKPLWSFGLTAGCLPRHPLYLRHEAPLELYRPAWPLPPLADDEEWAL